MHHFLYTLPLPAAVKPLFSGFKIHGNFTTLDLIAASTNALNGALLARRPDHYRSPGRGLGRDLALLSHGHLRASADSLGMRGKLASVVRSLSPFVPSRSSRLLYGDGASAGR